MTLLRGEPQPLEGKVKMELTVIGSRVQLWGLKMQLNCYNVYILFTGAQQFPSLSELHILPGTSLESKDIWQLLLRDQDVCLLCLPEKHHWEKVWSTTV